MDLSSTLDLVINVQKDVPSVIPLELVKYVTPDITYYRMLHVNKISFVTNHACLVQVPSSTNVLLVVKIEYSTKEFVLANPDSLHQLKTQSIVFH